MAGRGAEKDRIMCRGKTNVCSFSLTDVGTFLLYGGTKAVQHLATDTYVTYPHPSSGLPASVQPLSDNNRIPLPVISNRNLQ